MRVLSWNLNHRSRRRSLRPWIAPAIVEHAPDAVVLTEYVAGPDHARFVGTLAAAGLAHCSHTPTGGGNQLLVASRLPHERGPLKAPPLYSSVPTNFHHVVLADGTQLIGFRMPDFKNELLPLRRHVWEWLLPELDRLAFEPVVFTGDFNVAPGDPFEYGGDVFRRLKDIGWQHVAPTSGVSFRTQNAAGGRYIDHLFATQSFSASRSEFNWTFLEHHGLETVPVGVPDHAMLIADLSLVSLGHPLPNDGCY